MDEVMSKDAGCMPARDVCVGNDGYRTDAMIPLMASMLYGINSPGAKPSRKHDFQQLLLTLLKPCASAEDARAVIADMQDAVTSTGSIVESMVW